MTLGPARSIDWPEPNTTPAGSKPRGGGLRTDGLLSLALAGITALVFWNVSLCEFVNYDDLDYVTNNRHVSTGLNRENVLWALTATHASNWHPLTWLSLQVDATLFGLNPRAFHLTSLVLHISNTLLLYGVFRWMTGAPWRSAAVAGFFALHPLHVESVAWVAERKDVLSTLFWLLTMGAYFWYTKRPGITRYLLVVVFFGLGLGAKPMVVTLPCVLLLIDYWPLNRLKIGRGTLVGSAGGAVPVSRLLAEKVPLLLMSAASCVMTIVAQQKAMAALSHVSFKFRFLNALAVYLGYLQQTICPRDLCVVYLHPGDTLPLWKGISAAAVLLAITLGVVVLARRAAYLPVGWFWFLGTLVPVIGLVQVGEQAMADRYTYVPLIGVFISLAWGLPDLATTVGFRPQMLVPLVSVLLVACGVASHRQVFHWGTSKELWEQALRVDPRNGTAHNNLGASLLDRDDTEGALEHFEITLRLRPGYAKANSNLGLAYMNLGRFAEAAPPLLQAIETEPRIAAAHANLGRLCYFQGRLDESVAALRKAVELQPDRAKFHFDLACVLHAQGDAERSREQYREGVRLDPNWPALANESARLRATSRENRLRRGWEAVLLAQEACQATPEAPAHYLDTLAAAWAEQGSFDKAAATARKAEAAALGHDELKLAEQIRERLRLYERGVPYRQGK
jgi:tetratricopeptide (TPR) repeat protein